MTTPTLTLYGINNCDSVKKARKWLTEHAIEHAFIDLRQDATLPERLPHWLEQLGDKALVNRRSTSWRALSEAEKNGQGDAHWCALLAQQPTLIKRPVAVLPDGQIWLGFELSRYQSLLSA